MKLRSAFSILFALVVTPHARAQDVTFNEHIAPIVFNNCTVCHREGEIGPMPLTNYAEVSAYAAAIAEVTAQGIMPPWPPDRGFSRFVGERGLTEDQVRLLGDWARGGSSRGRPRTGAVPARFPGGIRPRRTRSHADGVGFLHHQGQQSR